MNEIHLFLDHVNKLQYKYVIVQVKMLSTYLAEIPVGIKKGRNNGMMEERKREKK